ncbi:MAG: hypothetical protein D6702_05935 [Planctomycetota bacterium]|nr:MAG: hypothetical protein D6702_05935 [Planctomycetota bacterium]
MPADAEAIEFWPAEWSGELLFLEVAPHGARVAAGEVIARLDPRGIDERIRAAEEDLDAARLSLRTAAAKAELETRAGQERIAAAERELERSRQELHAFHEFELPQRAKQAELQRLYAQDGIQDQEDELAQLQAMYEEDELVDETEDIVLKRSIRELERTRAAAELSEAGRRHQAEFSWRLEAERMEDAVHRQERELERMRQEFELDLRSRQSGLERQQRELERKEEALARLRADRERFELRAPRAGILLHGGVEDYFPGAAAPRHRRGGRGQLRAPLFTVAAPENFEVVVQVAESDLARVPAGAAVTVEPVVPTDVAITGRLEIDPFPLPESAGGPVNLYRGRVVCEGRLTGWAPGMRARVRLAAER